MINKIKIIYLLVIMGLFISCQKVVSINLNNAKKVYVIEGVITNQRGVCQVNISQTVDFSQPNNFPAVSGAVVTIKDNDALPVPLIETSPGTYQTNIINGTIGHTYQMVVNISGQFFTAITQMPVQVNMDSLYISELALFANKHKYASITFSDPLGKGNSYHYLQYKNGVLNQNIFVTNDDFTDGRVNNIILIEQKEDKVSEIMSGDIVRVEMQCIPTPMYTYWYSLFLSSAGSNQNATPGNAVTNINGNALGYFSAHTVQTKTIVAP